MFRMMMNSLFFDVWPLLFHRKFENVCLFFVFSVFHMFSWWPRGSNHFQLVNAFFLPVVSRWSLVAMARTKGDAGRRGTGRGRSRGGVQKRPARALEVDDDEADEAEASAEKSKSLDPNQIQNRLESYETVENRLDVEPKTEDVAKVVKVDAAASLAVPTASSAPSARSAPSAPSPRRSSQHVDETNDTHDANDADANVQSEAETESSGSSASRSELDEEMLGDLPYLVAGRFFKKPFCSIASIFYEDSGKMELI